jgi:hypothetical protein
MVINFTDVKTAQAQKIADLEAQVRALKLQLQGAKDTEPQDPEPQPQPQPLLEVTEPEALTPRPE